MPFAPASLTIRALDPERDLHGYLRVMHQVDRFPRSAPEWWELERMALPGAFRRHLVAERAGEIVAAAALVDHQMSANAVAGRLVVDAVHRGRGIGRAMAAAAEALIAERAPDAVEVRLRDDDAASRAWAERRGFRFRDHVIRSELDLSGFEPSRHRDAVARAEAAGVRFETPADGDRLYEIYARLMRDVPDRLEPPSREWFRRTREGRSDVVPLVACARDDWVGVTVASPAEPDGAWNDFTGVAREHRGRGIAHALKALVAEELARRGRRWVQTANNARNAPMLAVNRSLGYRPVAGLVFLRRAQTSQFDPDRPSRAEYPGLRRDRATGA